MKVVVYLKKGSSLSYSDATLTPPSMATPYYLVIAQDGLHYFHQESVERVSAFKNQPEDA